MSRLQTIPSVHALDALPESFCQDLKTDVDYFCTPGSTIAVAGTTVTTTARFHELTSGTPVNTITDSLGAVQGQELFLWCQLATVFSVTGGNIKTIMGQDYAAAANETVKFVFDGAYWWPTNVPKRWAKVTPKAVNTTTAFADLLNGEFTPPAGCMGESGLLTLKAWGDWENNSTGVKALPRWQVLFGGATFLDTGATGNVCGNAIGRYGWGIELTIQNLAHNSQQCYIKVGLMYLDGSASDSDNVFTVGNGSFWAHGMGFGAYSRYVAEGGNSGLAVDTSAAQALKLNVKNGFSHAQYETKLFGAVATIL